MRITKLPRIALLILTVMAGVAYAAETPPAVTLRGKLVVCEGKPATLQTAEHKLVKLAGDASTVKVLGDARLNGFEVEAKGHFTATGEFLIDPLHTRAMMVHKDGHLKVVTYWCDVCSLRAYTSGPCVCCGKETTLDLIDPAELDK
jgi:hypothetical protein